MSDNYCAMTETSLLSSNFKAELDDVLERAYQIWDQPLVAKACQSTKQPGYFWIELVPLHDGRIGPAVIEGSIMHSCPNRALQELREDLLWKLNLSSGQ